jgi:hypothetical protein
MVDLLRVYLDLEEWAKAWEEEGEEDLEAIALSTMDSIWRHLPAEDIAFLDRRNVGDKK